MFNLEKITEQVRRNCDISDAKNAGLFSICGLALRLRNLYKWEHGLEPWVEKDTSEILDWIADKEARWESMAEEIFLPIHIQNRSYDPFDTLPINRALRCHGIFYGAGLGHGLKPTFLLAPIRQEKTIKGSRVLILGTEAARDLFTAPALVQDDSIIIRTETVKAFLWDQILYVNKSGKQAMTLALAQYGLNYHRFQDLKQHLDRMAETEMEMYIRHELGEIQERYFNLDTWRAIVAAYPLSPIELLARAVKDLLADTHPDGTLPYVIRTRKIASLGFYIASMEGLPKKLFPAIIDAFEDFQKTGDWSFIETAVHSGRILAKEYADAMMHIFRRARQKNDYPWAEREMTRHLLKPLGI